MGCHFIGTTRISSIWTSRTTSSFWKLTLRTKSQNAIVLLGTLEEVSFLMLVTVRGSVSCAVVEVQVWIFKPWNLHCYKFGDRCDDNTRYDEDVCKVCTVVCSSKNTYFVELKAWQPIWVSAKNCESIQQLFYNTSIVISVYLADELSKSLKDSSDAMSLWHVKHVFWSNGTWWPYDLDGKHQSLAQIMNSRSRVHLVGYLQDENIPRSPLLIGYH